MTTQDKLGLIEKTLSVAPNSLQEDTILSTLPSWDSFTMLSLQVELTAFQPDVQFDNLYTCVTVGDICEMM